jgi:Tfp pilus assembly protein FimT
MELMITLTIAAVILGIAAPSFTTFRQNNRLSGVANDLLGAMQTARTEAIKRQVPVSVCPSDNPDSGAPTCTAGDFTGWISFVDADSNCLRTNVALPDGTNETDPPNLIRTGGPIETAVTVRSNGNCVSFAPTGFLQTVAGRPTAGFTFFWDSAFKTPKCGPQPETPNESRAREVEVTNTGRSRITRVLADVTAALAVSGVSCP